MHASRLVSLAPVLLLGVVATAQNTVPHFSTYFGGTDRDVGEVVRLGSNGEVTVVGTTRSLGLATPGAFQQTIQPSPVPLPYGDVDAFIARFVPLVPGPGYMLQWCTYLGGSGLELVFDAEVDAAAITTVVGLSTSTDFPDPTGTNPPALSGSSDGFLAMIDPTGSVCLASMFFGTPDDDRVCEVELDPTGGAVMIAGIVEGSIGSSNLPAATNTHHGGYTDVFVARVVPFANPPVALWSTYLGGNNTEGIRFSSWPGFTVWEGNLDRMSMTLDADGDPAVVTAAFYASVPAQTPGNPFQPGQAGQADNYLAVLDRTTGVLTYGTFCGGSTNDRPKTIVAHPAGGFVFGGVVNSSNYPTTPTSLQPAISGTNPVQFDGFLTWLDPGLPPTQQLRYSTYFGSAAGEDNVLAVACESSGVITFAGYTKGPVPLTPRCWQPAGSASLYGCLVRLEPSGLGASDLHYGTLVGSGTSGTILTSLALDDYGDAWFTARSAGAGYQVTNSSSWSGSYDPCLTYLPLLPGGVAREESTFGTPTCGTPPVPMHMGVAWPATPNTVFGITVTDAPPNGTGMLALGWPRATPLGLPPQLGGWLLVDSVANVLVFANAEGHTRVDLHLPQGPNGPLTWGFGAQWFFLTNAACPGSGRLGNSERLVF